MKNKISHIKAIIFDLDDTLIDTYGLLIIPLEMKSAEKMVQIDGSLPSPDELAALLLEIRRKNPGNLEKEFQKRIPRITENVWQARRRVFKKISLSGLFIDQQIKLFLETLKSKYHLYLLTEGDLDFQNAKINLLEIRNLFKEIVSISKESGKNKEEAILSLLQINQYESGSVLVVGNRLDKEIRAAARLGMPAVWIRHGEGCEMTPDTPTGSPDFIFENILELQKLFNVKA